MNTDEQFTKHKHILTRSVHKTFRQHGSLLKHNGLTADDLIGELHETFLDVLNTHDPLLAPFGAYLQQRVYYRLHDIVKRLARRERCAPTRRVEHQFNIAVTEAPPADYDSELVVRLLHTKGIVPTKRAGNWKDRTRYNIVGRLRKLGWSRHRIHKAFRNVENSVAANQTIHVSETKYPDD